ncbi:DNA excision repair protein ERCC-1 isoform X2 [Carcharodon carcharias]|uniref:DNA excision repair protein ERCC-1 isoform X2 n=1 Tax=Carcharodon carcharias TaxID=13397 RepID=UPI001B7EF952|nr:DNA excision repair protein ERCC-1 isoform X2 [Carcharodon carcharias]
MNESGGTPKRFLIPDPEQVYRSDPDPVRPLFRPGVSLARGGGQSEAPAAPRACPSPPPAGRRGETGVSGGPGSADRGSGGDGADAGPTTAAKRLAAKQNTIVVSPRQRGNPILKFIRNVPWEFGDVVPDYILGQTACALYLSLRYHCLNRDYIHKRLRELGQAFALRVLLVHVDVKDPYQDLKELARISLLADCTLILAWSSEEAGRYLETYKAYENKPSDVLKERVENDYVSKVTDCLTTVKSVNKTDSLTLINTFKSLKDVVEASREELSLCPGLGPQKARRLFDVFHEPFLRLPRPDPGKTGT